MQSAIPPTENDTEQLPFDPRTVAIAIWSHRRLLLRSCILAAVLGAAVGLLFGTRVYESETLLLYRGAQDVVDRRAQLRTAANLVKLPNQLAVVRERLELPASLTTLGAAVHVATHDDRDLLIIRGRWDDAATAARLTDAVRDVFVEGQVHLQDLDAQARVADLNRRIESVRTSLGAADARLQDFTQTNQVVDLDKEAQQYLEQLVALELMLAEAQAEKESFTRQRSNMDDVFATMREQAEREAESDSGQTENLGQLNTRFRRLRDAIHDDQKQRAETALYEQARVELQQAEDLWNEGLISRLEVEQARNRFDAQEALAVDTEQIEVWRDEIADLDARIMPSGDQSTISGNLLSSMLLRSFDIQLEDLALEDKIVFLQSARLEVTERLRSMPAKQKRFVELRRDVDAYEVELESLENQRAAEQLRLSSRVSPFQTVAAGSVPAYPVDSNRRQLAAIVALGILFVAFTGVAAWHLLYPWVRSAAELELKLGLESLVTFHPACSPTEVEEEFRTLATRLRTIAGAPQVLALISPRAGDGRRFVLEGLAASLNSQGRSVIRVEADLPGPGPNDGSGLADFLEGRLAEPPVLQADGGDRIPRGSTPSRVDLLSQPRFTELLQRLRDEYDFVLVEGPTLAHQADAIALGEAVDGIVLVSGCGGTKVSTLRRFMTSFNRLGTPVLGAVLTRMDPLYREAA